jgi:hypothetical protein
MAQFKLPPAYDPAHNYAIPEYMQKEGLTNRAIVTKWQPRGSYDNPNAFDPSWDKAYAVPEYILDEGYGQGAKVTDWYPRGYYDGATKTAARIKTAQKALGDAALAEPVPAQKFGRSAAAKILTQVRALPPAARKKQLRAMLDRIDPRLWDRVYQLARQYTETRGVPAGQGLELALARALSQTAVSALGDVVAPKAGFSILSTTSSVTGLQATPPKPGDCSADGQFIWKVSSTGAGFWARLAVGETCTPSSATGPTIRTGGGGGITVGPTTVMKIGPFTIPVVRSGNTYTWGLDDYAKLPADVGPMIGEALRKRIDYPGRSNWVTIRQPMTLFAPGSTYDMQTYQSGKPTGTVIRTTWPLLAPWGQTWLTQLGWMAKFGFNTGDAYEDRYNGFDTAKYAPIAQFDHPQSGAKYGLWMRLQPVGPDIPALSASTIVAGVENPVPYSTKSYALQFKIAPMPDKGVLGGFLDWILKYVKKLIVAFYDAVQDVGKELSDALCAMAQTPGGPAAAAAAGGPYAAAASAATTVLLAGKCPVPQSQIQDSKSDLLPLAIAGGAVVAIYFFTRKKA